MQELASSPKNGWEVYRSPEHRKAMYELADAYMDFLTASKTERETVSEVIARLTEAGYAEGFATDKAWQALHGKAIFKADDELCDKYFNGLFDYAVGERVGVKRKPSPDAVYEVLSHLNIEKDESVYVGDSEVDIKTAKNADMESIIVSWGFRDKEYLYEQGAVCIVNDCDALEAVIIGRV